MPDNKIQEVDLSALNDLSPEERKLAIEMLKEIADTGKSETLEKMKYGDFEEVPVDIHTFLHDKRYLGNGLYDQDGRFTLFPYWEETLKKIFPDNITTAYNTLILTGCLAYDTEIPLLNGKNVKIGDLAKQGDLDEYVYSYDVETDSYAPGHLVAAFSTGKKPIYNITLDNGTVIKATANHQFMTRDKHWKSIDTGLAAGDSMMPFNRKYGSIANRAGYEIIENPNKDGTTTDMFTHRLVMNWKHGKYKGVVHHADFNKNNNDPRNLILTDWVTHKMYHAKRGGDRWRDFNKKRANKEISPELEQRIKDGALKGCLNRWAKEEEHQKMSDLTTSRMNNGFAKEMAYNVWNGKNADINRQRNSAIITAVNKDKNRINQYQISKAIKISNIALVEFGELTEETYEKTKKRHNMRIGYPSFKSILKRITFEELLSQAQTYNHKIVKIEYAGEEEVYDLTVDKYHNFAINNGIIAHNSIGIGKSTCAVVCQLYMLYRLLCLKDPYLYYGMQPIDKITISLMNITIENAKGVALDKLNQLILSSDWFMSHGEMHGTTNMIFVPNKHIEFVCASSNNQIIGRALFCLDGDTEIVTSDGIEKIKNLVDKPIKVISVDDAGQKILSDTCTVKPTIKTEEEYEIELEDGTVIKCTPNHRLRLKDGSYKEAQYLTENDELMDVQVTYNEFINNIIKTRGQWGIKKGEYKEVHHIIPKCMGGLPNNKTLSYAEKNSHHKNLIWLTAEEHYIAHKLLYLEHPDNYGLFAAWRHISRNGQLKKEDYDLLKNYNHKLPDQILNEIEKNGEFRYKKVQTYCKKTNRNTDKYKKEMQRRKAYGIGNLSGAKNGMYKNGYKIANGNNGHASIRYFYLDKTFESRKELLEYLWSNNIKITSSAIRKIVHNTGTLRVYNMYKDVFDNLKWEFKDEN